MNYFKPTALPTLPIAPVTPVKIERLLVTGAAVGLEDEVEEVEEVVASVAVGVLEDVVVVNILDEDLLRAVVPLLLLLLELLLLLLLSGEYGKEVTSGVDVICVLI